MKKLTKITALALALALILGMTAFAGTPSTLLLSDDFSDVTDLSFDTAKATRSYLDSVSKGGSSLTFVSGYNKYFYGSSSEFVNVNGNIAFQDKSAIATTAKTSLAYTLDTPWTYDDNKGGEYALVAQIDWTPVAINAQTKKQVQYGSGGFAGVIWDTEAQTNDLKSYDADNDGEVDGSDVNEAAKTDTYQPLFGKTIPANTSTLHVHGWDQHGNSESALSATLVPGDKINLTMVVRPNWHGSVTNGEDNYIATGSLPALDIIKYAERKVLTTGYINTARASYTETKKITKDSDGDGTNETYSYTRTKYPAYIKAIDGFYFISSNYVQNRYEDFKMYKLSLNRADFKFDTMTTTGIAPDNAFEVVFNQPIAANTGVHSYAGNRVNISTIINVAKGEETLTYGEDYTLEVSEKIVDNTVKGVLSIVPVGTWDFGTDYTVTIPATQGAIMSAARISMLPENISPVTFTTEAAPTFAMTLNAYAGLNDSGAELADLKAGTVYFKATAVQSAGKDLANGYVKIAVYEDGEIVKYATAKRTFDSAATFTAALKVKAGQTVKAFVDGTLGEATID